MHLVTGHKGEEHIMSADQGSFNASFFGTGQNVMEAGSQFEATILDNNTVRIFDGDLLMYGRHARIEPNTYEDYTIQTGTAGVNRYDLICATYTKNTNDGIEDAYIEVIKGTESESVPDLPAYTDGNILNGATFNQMPLYKVVIEGVVLKELVPLFTTIPTYKALGEKYAAAFQKACETFLGALNIYDTMEEIEANTQENQLAGALAVKELMQRVNDIDLSASKVTYDNASSKLSSKTAQGAIDELKGVIEDVNENFSQAHDALVASLAYSGLGITEDMTFDEMTEVFAKAFPQIIDIMQSTMAKWSNTGTSVSTAYVTFANDNTTMTFSQSDFGASSISCVYADTIGCTKNTKITLTANASATLHHNDGNTTVAMVLQAKEEGSSEWKNVHVFLNASGSNYSTFTDSQTEKVVDLSSFAEKRINMRLYFRKYNNQYQKETNRASNTLKITKFKVSI